MSLSQAPTPLPRTEEALLYCGVVDGAVEVQGGDASSLTLRAGASLVVRPGAALSLQAAEGKISSTCAALVLAIGLDVGRHLVRQLAPNGKGDAGAIADVSHVRIDNSPLLRASLQALVTLSTHDAPHHSALLGLNATRLLIHLLQTPAGPLLLQEHDPSHSLPGIDAAVQYVQRHFQRPLSVDELAAEACMSRSTFYRHFQATLRMTPLEYVTRVRIEHAQVLLRDPERTVTDVSLALGFGSVSHFIDLFRRRVGVTPRTYQQSLRMPGDAR